jgi:hypothetical protein
MVLGSWFAGDLRHFNPYRSQNYYLENRSIRSTESNDNARRHFKAHALKGVSGETLSVLIDDIDRDGHAELWVGNDMDTPDILYHWRGGRFEIAEPNKDLPAVSSFNTMSLASGDLNKDSNIDYFSVDMSFTNQGGEDYCAQPGVHGKTQCREVLAQDNAVKQGRITACEHLSNDTVRTACLEAQIIQLAKSARQPEFCQSLSSDEENSDGANNVLNELCLAASMAIPPKAEYNYADYPEGIQRNVLLLSNGEEWIERAGQWGVTESHWSWHSKIADFNNSGWNDIYVGNGYMFGGTGRRVQSNTFFVNERGKGMRQAEEEFGLVDYLNTPSFVTVDFDRDGDLDIISNRVAADHGVFINQSRRSGTFIEILEGDNPVLGLRLTLESKRTPNLSHTSQQILGGGFLSFDEALMHYGVGEANEYDQLLIHWPDGQKEALTLQIQAGSYYQISLDSP